MAASRNSILRLINASQNSACPCHGCRPQVSAVSQLQSINQLRNFATPVNTEKEYAFEVCSEHLIVLKISSDALVAGSRLQFALW